MTLQIIKSIDGKEEYVLLPISAYKLLKKEIDRVIKDEYVPFELEDYVSSPIALARIHANLTQEQLAALMKVTQAYISKIEAKGTASPKTLEKVYQAIRSSHRADR